MKQESIMLYICYCGKYKILLYSSINESLRQMGIRGYYIKIYSTYRKFLKDRLLKSPVQPFT